MAVDDKDVRACAERWAKNDPDPTTRAELCMLLREPDLARTDLADRFAGALEFGTAGLRGVLGAGPRRMNRAVVIRATWALAQVLRVQVPDAAARGVVIGYDARRRSREFADDAAGVLAAAGITVRMFTTTAPTPLVAFAARSLAAAGAVVVTASHNPAEYSGYKVYWDNAAQIIPPVDALIAARIAAAPGALSVPRSSLAEARAGGRLVELGADVEQAYVDAVCGLCVAPGRGFPLRIVYTAMHGVGGQLAVRALAQAGFSDVRTVAEQQQPDPTFPTVAFPNPEEKGALDRAVALARRVRADLVLANDPDADRLAVAVPQRDDPDLYVQLTGNEVGVLLGHYLLTRGRDAGAAGRLVIATLVSSPMLSAIACALGVRYEETLTGFKWIMNRALELERTERCVFVFGYEEALGYAARMAVRDKDGISAAVLMAELAAGLRARGESVLGWLEALYRDYGLFASFRVSLVEGPGLADIAATMARLRAAPPTSVGRERVVRMADYKAQQRVDRTTGERSMTALPPSDVVAFDLEGGSRIMVRPSGTEPKLKVYFDVRCDVAPTESIADANVRANAMLKALSHEFVQGVLADPTSRSPNE